MANLAQWLINGNRLNIVHLKAAIDVGYTGFAGPEGMFITIRANDRENPKERDYRLELDRISLGKVIVRLLNPTGEMPMHQFASSTAPRSNEGNLYQKLLEEHGIKFSTYRYPAEPYANGTKRWYWCEGVNRYHAEHQMARLLKSFKPQLLEEYNEGST
jgi:hypothetical protein